MIGALVVGAGLMYLLDPDRGARRRALVRDQAAHAGHRLRGGLGATTRDVGNRARGAASELRSRLRHEEVDDVVLRERVRSEAGRVVSHPHAMEVVVSGGRVALHGSVPEHELDDLLRAVRRVRGVTEVTDNLETMASASTARAST
ncbi:MAG: BON domain-containing protein [Gemmatimonadales bacterium]